MARKWLVLCTAALAFLLLALLWLMQEGRLPSTSLDVENLPILGNPHAKVQIVAFEDFRCTNCRVFSEEIFPKIYSTYIETQKAYYVFVPLAFLEKSKPLANAALAVYSQAPNRFLAFTEKLFSSFEEQEVGVDELLKLARSTGGIDLAKLREAIEQERFYKELDRNLGQARKLMGGDVKAPALYIDGKRVSTHSFEAIQEQVEAALR